MTYALRRLALGLLLIGLASAILLMADLGRRAPAASPVLRLAIFQHTDSSVLDDGVAGVLEALAERGYRDGGRVTIERFNAQNDMPTSATIAARLVSGGYDLVVTVSTPSMQAVANANTGGRVRHVFTLVSDPFTTGVGLDRDDPLAHPPHMAGLGTLPPAEMALVHARRLFPALERVGLAWNPAESNSQVFVEGARAVAAGMGLTLLEANVDSTAVVADAVNSLLGRGAQAIWVGADNTTATAVDSIIAIGRRARVPVFSVLPGAPDRGTLFDVGVDYVEAGRQVGHLAADVLEGADMRGMPIRDVIEVSPPVLFVNTTLLGELRDPWRVQPETLAAATVVVDENGIHRRDTPRAAATPRPLSKRWRLQYIQLNQVPDIEDAEAGVNDGLREAGLVEGRDFEKVVRNAGGDMATVSALVDAAVTDRADLLITFSTPSLQAAMQRAPRSLPIVFNYLADPVAAGAGKSDTDHAPNVTGVYLLGAYAEMMPLIRAVRPGARVLGTVYVPAEVNQVVQLDLLNAAASDAGMEIRAVAANSTAEVADATLALIANGVDIICQVPGNLTASAFPSIAQAARQARMPMFVFMSSQARAGAVLALARDYYDSGRQAAGIAARVMRGESTADIPLVGFGGTRLVVNLDAARALGVTIPPRLVERADEVIGR